jgi:hypothetical protein
MFQLHLGTGPPTGEKGGLNATSGVRPGNQSWKWYVFLAGEGQPNDPTSPVTTLKTAWTKGKHHMNPSGGEQIFSAKWGSEQSQTSRRAARALAPKSRAAEKQRPNGASVLSRGKISRDGTGSLSEHGHEKTR